MVVAASDTAVAVGSGDVPVLATPRVVALAEAATVAAVAPALPAGCTTVGTRVELDHTAATGVGATVLAEATLSGVDGRQLWFDVTVRELPAPSELPSPPEAAAPTVATGRVGRMVVDRERFLARVPAAGRPRRPLGSPSGATPAGEVGSP